MNPPHSDAVAPESPPQRRAVADGGATRAQLIEAARAIIAADGVAAATSRRITEVAGANLAAITYWFGSKESLVHAALRAEVEDLVQPALDQLESDAPPAQRVASAVTGMLSTFADKRDRSTVYLTALLESTRQSGHHRSSDDVVRRIRQRLASVNGELKDGGSVPAWVDPDAMAALIVATCNGIVLQSALEPEGPTPEAMAGQLTLLLLAAATTGSGSEGVEP